MDAAKKATFRGGRKVIESAYELHSEPTILGAMASMGLSVSISWAPPLAHLSDYNKLANTKIRKFSPQLRLPWLLFLGCNLNPNSVHCSPFAKQTN